MGRNIGSLLIALVLLAVPRVGSADEHRRVHVSAYACESLPKPLAVEVDLGDDSESYRKLRDVLVDSLAGRQVAVRDGASLRLSLYLETQRESERRKGRDLGQFSQGNSSDQRTRFRMTLWSNRQDSVFGGRKDRVLYKAVNELRIAITINDMRNGRCVWQGEAKYDLDGADEFRTAARVIPLLTRQLGRTVKNQTLALD